MVVLCMLLAACALTALHLTIDASIERSQTFLFTDGFLGARLSRRARHRRVTYRLLSGGLNSITLLAALALSLHGQRLLPLYALLIVTGWWAFGICKNRSNTRIARHQGFLRRVDHNLIHNVRTVYFVAYRE